MNTPHGYDYGTPQLATNPITLADLDLLNATLLWSPADSAALARAGAILAPQVQSVLDVWYGFVASNTHLVATFSGSDGAPSGQYLDAVRSRFAKWIVDICTQTRDQEWLDWQNEIAVRHHRTKKNLTDGIISTSAEVPLRYLIAFIVPITLTINGFLAKGAQTHDELEAMQTAWFKAVTLTSVIWAQPYTPNSW